MGGGDRPWLIRVLHRVAFQGIVPGVLSHIRDWLGRFGRYLAGLWRSWRTRCSRVWRSWRARCSRLGSLRVLFAKRLILFLVPGEEFISGGILSIFNLYRFSRELAAAHGGRVVMCTYPSEARPGMRYTMFKNDVAIHSFEDVMKLAPRRSELLVHIPEYAAERVVAAIGWEDLRRLAAERTVRVNILNQNVELMPDQPFLERLKLTVAEVTCTTAHPSYSTRAYRALVGIPCHHIPAWMHPDDAPATPAQSKRELMLVSPDPSPHREAVLSLIAANFPQLEIRVVWDLKFQDYLELERAAKWSLTFGEGMDGYFLGVFLRGGIGFAVFNEVFFTPEYRSLRTVYPSFEALLDRIVDDIRLFEADEGLRTDYNAATRSLIARTWDPAKTRAALAAFYRREWTAP
jgi:hypothetical protein